MEICFYVINIKQVVQEALPIMVIRKKINIYAQRMGKGGNKELSS